MTFPLVANLKVNEQISRALLLGKFPHAVILSGEEGQGKKTLARYIANALVCTAGQKPCGECKNCRVAAANSHPDIIIVKRGNGKKEIRIDQIRKIKTDAFIKSHMANAKVFIIEDADTMNEIAQNAFLKILEEPPLNVFFLLTAINRDKLLDTVLSRTVTFTLSSPDISEGAKVVSDAANVDLQTATNLLQKTRGNIGAAISLNSDKKGVAANTVAEKFCSLIFEGSSYDLLKLLNPYTKDRVFFDAFFTELSLVLISEIPKLSSGGKRAKVLFWILEKIKDYKKMLSTNANISLLVSSMVADINEQLR